MKIDNLMKYLGWLMFCLTTIITINIAYRYNLLIKGNAITLTILLFSFGIMFLSLIAYHFGNRFNREAGISTWWDYIRVTGTTILIIISPIIFTEISYFFLESGQFQISQLLYKLRFWSIPLTISLTLIFNFSISRWRKRSNNHFPRD